MNHDHAWRLIDQEYFKATIDHQPLHSPHEGFAVILEEMEELKAEVFKNASTRRVEKLKLEAKQVAAMALRFLVDLC